MTAEEAFALAFHDADVVVVIDDWKAARTTLTTGHSYFAARTFFSADPSTAQLYQLLSDSGARDWHACGSRSESHFLFDCPEFDAILQWMNLATTCRYDMLASVEALQAEHVRAKWQHILATNPQLRPTWDVSSPYAPSLFRFADFLASRMTDELNPGMRVRLGAS